MMLFGATITAGTGVLGAAAATSLVVTFPPGSGYLRTLLQALGTF